MLQFAPIQTHALSAAEDPQQIAQVLAGAVEHARACNDGQPADYIPELASADVQKTSAAVSLVGGNCILAGDADTHRFSLQSAAKLILLAGLLEDRGSLETYFCALSLEASVREAAQLASALAASGVSPKGERIVGPDTATTVVALMATCGMYDESGTYLRITGLPAKSGVSGVIVAVAVRHAGVAVASPRINQRGGSVRGHLILQELGEKLGWHFARGRNGYVANSVDSSLAHPAPGLPRTR